MKTIIIICFTLLLLNVTVYAQPDTNRLNTIPLDVLKAQDIIAGRASTNVEVVSASRSSKRIKDLPVTIHVVTQEEIRKNGYITLVDVMKAVPGVRVSQPGSGLDGETFLFRGQIGNYYTKILINNIPIQPSVAGGIAIGAQLPIAQARQIEIIYGPASAVYGADAMTGVINIITDSPSSRSFAQANVTLGEYGYQHVNFMAGGKVGKNKNILKYTFYGNRGKRDDLNIRHNKEVELVGQVSSEFSYKGNVFSPLPHFFASKRMSSDQINYLRLLNTNPGQVLDSIQATYPYYQGDANKGLVNALPQESSLFGIQLEYRDFTFSYNNLFRSNHSSLGRSPDIFSYARSDNYIADRIERITLSYNKAWQRFALTVNASYLKYRMDVGSTYGVNYASFASARAYTYEASDDLFFEALGTYSINKYMEITAGFSATFSGNLPPVNESDTPFNPGDYQAFSTTQRAPHAVFGHFGDNPILHTITGYFAQLLYQRDNLTLIAGVREDASSEFTTNVDSANAVGSFYPRVAVLYKFNNNLSVRASYGRAFKAPSARNTYSSLALPVIFNGTRVPNLVQYERVPNEDLSPEFVTSYEVGVRYTLNSNIDFDLTGYYSRIDQLITQSLIPLDTSIYGANAVSQFQTQNNFRTRSAVNDVNSRSDLYGLQLAVRLSNLLPLLKLNADVYLNYAEGSEILPNEENEEISVPRMVPKFMGQLNFSIEPFKHTYFRFENVFMTDWVRRFVPRADASDFKVEGYYNLDFIGRYQLSKHLGVFLKIRNVFDAEYAGIGSDGLDVDLVYNPQMKRNVQFGASFRL
ncbi:TonB-dependent siderophore receptor [uncultured Microscilla sp.]|uniref:TonB-dependent receptor plug domain-containing protein n=1 Tax=uncultured Microscilla sp. TaxID=432653 RepID=UPI002620572E|nr:TonB-dependent receptor [uncultured Microscilla sp.]